MHYGALDMMASLLAGKDDTIHHRPDLLETSDRESQGEGFENLIGMNHYYLIRHCEK